MSNYLKSKPVVNDIISWLIDLKLDQHLPIVKSLLEKDLLKMDVALVNNIGPYELSKISHEDMFSTSNKDKLIKYYEDDLENPQDIFPIIEEESIEEVKLCINNIANFINDFNQATKLRIYIDYYNKKDADDFFGFESENLKNNNGIEGIYFTLENVYKSTSRNKRKLTSMGRKWLKYYSSKKVLDMESCSYLFF